MDDPAKVAAMEAWLDKVCAALGVDREAMAELTPAVLDLVGSVARGPSRPGAPLTAFAVGLAAGAREGGTVVERVRTELEKVQQLVAGRPSVLFVCVHNAGRSQMAAAYLEALSGGAVEVRSAGSAPGDRVNPAAVAAMAEEGIDMSAAKPKILTDEAVLASDVVITMGCGDACPFYPGKRYLDWELDDPAGKGVEAVRPIRDEIKRRVLGLLHDLGVPVQS